MSDCTNTAATTEERVKINKDDPEEVAYMHRQFPLMQYELIVEAIEEAGPYKDEIMTYLNCRK
ncbi:hypothetical protein SAMN05421788_102472 [Filimonas lacunae]|uniref:CUE domain-containing protein n=1 Tax=Filimonas lacunae TaxID=477680 RepID=A0A173MH23_9BACT|nr:hypothetical protein [Filimonas lacunae]BAV06895.1 hypothetical protein FLA_2915 [Filimonas lacunae]SIS98212.1 hypothetical protein SAMN05421788_102472 [Filimonas lacunae]